MFAGQGLEVDESFGDSSQKTYIDLRCIDLASCPGGKASNCGEGTKLSSSGLLSTNTASVPSYLRTMHK